MFHFLENMYKRNPKYIIGSLLGDICLLTDGTPADPAVISDWGKAVEYALGGGEPGLLKIE